MNTNIITKKRWAVAILAVVLVAILSVTLVACGTKDSSETSSGEITAEQAPVYDFTAEIQNTEFIKLAMSAAVANSENGSVSKTLTATVTPATASNKLVDWSVAWGDASNVTDVSEYITVTPSGDGSTGLNMVTVPNVVGISSLEEASKILASNNLSLGSYTYRRDGSPSGTSL